MMEPSTAKGVLNGLIGDYLDSTRNELAIPMDFYVDNVPLDINVIKQRLEKNPAICILVHGLTDDERTWCLDDGGGDYGAFLERDFGYVPIYLRYNTGLHISTNGQKLNSLLNSLIAHCSSDSLVPTIRVDRERIVPLV